MSMQNDSFSLPDWHDFIGSLEILPLVISASTLHGQLCGLLCAEEEHKAESYLLALIGSQKGVAAKNAFKVIFQVYSVSQQQIVHGDFGFQLMLPTDEEVLFERALAFTEWCNGFLQGLTMAGVGDAELEEDGHEALQYIREFAELDCSSLDISEDDEKAFMEVSEYTRMAVLRIHGDYMTHKNRGQGKNSCHH